jgi:hypothetical protein
MSKQIAAAPIDFPWRWLPAAAVYIAALLTLTGLLLWSAGDASGPLQIVLATACAAFGVLHWIVAFVTAVLWAGLTSLRTNLKNDCRGPT